MNFKQINDTFIRNISGLTFDRPISHVYNPLEYARQPYDLYLKLYGNTPKEILLLGMNPGPWGMAQTGIPFGEITMVKNWLKLEAPVEIPDDTHPKKPILGFECKRSEVSGQRLWGWARRRYITPERFFSRYFIANYCPLLFIEPTGRNRTPDNLPVGQRRPLLKICDLALRQTVELLKPRHVIGVGQFAASRAGQALTGMNVCIGKVNHPSPANPRANRGWGKLVEGELSAMGIRL